MLYEFTLFSGSLHDISASKKLITTINAHSYNTLHNDIVFKEALKNSDILLPDGISMVWAYRILKGQNIKKIAGEDLFYHEMRWANENAGTCFFMGSTDKNLTLIKAKAAKDFPNVSIHTYSPPFKSEFTEKENQDIIDRINQVKPDVLFIGMTAPKQEKWAFNNIQRLKAVHICCIGAVFDFYAGTIKRAPTWMINSGIEWLYRLVKEPRRMWKRYIIGNTLFVARILNSRISKAKSYKSNYLITKEAKANNKGERD